MWLDVQRFDQELSQLYRNLNQSDKTKPDVGSIKKALHATIHSMEMAYGTTGSLFRSGSRQTFFASQVMRFADIYASSLLNLLYYPTFYMFRSPAMLLPHEATVSHLQPGGGQDTADSVDSGSEVDSGKEPTATHDMDDDEIDGEDTETSSDQSN